MRRRRWPFAAALALCAASTLAQDGSGSKWPGKSWTVNPVLNQRLTVFGGAAYTFVDAKVRGQDRLDGSGAEIDLDDLGIDDGDWSALVGGQFRFGKKRQFKLLATYFSTDVSGSAALGQPIEYDGEILAATLKAEYRFRERIGVGAGFRYIDTDVTVTNQSYKDTYDVDYYGPFLFMSVGF